MNKYELWIENWLLSNSPNWACETATKLMAEEFPELTRVPGRVVCEVQGSMNHWWLENEDEEIVDPTVSQFQIPNGLIYEKWTPGTPTKVGKCMNCGESIFENLNSLSDSPSVSTTSCSEECQASLHRYYNS